MTYVIFPTYFNLCLNLESIVFYPLKYFPGIGYLNHNVYSVLDMVSQVRSKFNGDITNILPLKRKVTHRFHGREIP